VQLEVLASNGYTVWDADNGLLSVQVRRGADEMDLKYIYIVVTTAGNSESYFVNALEPNKEKLYYFGEIAKKPDEISVYASIPLKEKGVASTSNSKATNIPIGNLDELVIINSGNTIYLPNGRVKDYDCKILEGEVYVNAEEGSYCFYNPSTVGVCDDAGECHDWECAIDLNCYRGNPCEEEACNANVCEYIEIPDCNLPEGKCGNGVIDEGEACDMFVFDNNTCQSEGFYTGTLSCSSNCQSVITSSCWGYTLEESSEEWRDCDTLWRTLGGDQAWQYPHDILFYGQVYTEFYIDSNGKINLPLEGTAFHESLDDYNTQDTYADDYNKGIIAPLWMDLEEDLTDGVDVYVCEGEPTVIRWDSEENGVPGNVEDFEMIIYDSGEIYFVYNQITIPSGDVFYGVINPASGEDNYYRGELDFPSSDAYRLVFEEQS